MVGLALFAETRVSIKFFVTIYFRLYARIRAIFHINALKRAGPPIGRQASQSSVHTTKASISLNNFSFYKFCLFICRLQNENLYANIGCRGKIKVARVIWLSEPAQVGGLAFPCKREVRSSPLTVLLGLAVPRGLPLLHINTLLGFLSKIIFRKHLATTD